MDTLIVNGDVIAPETIYQEMQYYSAPNAEDAHEQATRSLIIKRLLEEEVDKRGLLPDENNSEHRIEALFQQQVFNNLEDITEQECLRFYQSNTTKFTSSPLVEARHILLAAAPEDTKARTEKLAQAAALIERVLESPGQFADLAQKFSDCPSKETGGSLGQLQKGQTVPEFERILLSAPIGLISVPVESRYGVHLVEIANTVRGKTLPFEKVQQKIKEYLLEQQERHAIADFLNQLVENAEIQGYDMQHPPLIQ